MNIIIKSRKYLGKNKLVRRIFHMVFYFEPKYFFPDTFTGSKLYGLIMPNLIQKELKTRTNLLKTLDKNTVKISDKEGFTFYCSKTNLINSAVDVALKILNQSRIENADYSQLKTQYEKAFLCMIDIDLNIDSNLPIKKLITSNEILSIVSNYFGHIPILSAVKLLYSPNKELEDGRSQQWHMDGGDGKNIKIFIALEEIDEDTGPFVFIPKHLSRLAYSSMKDHKVTKRRNFKIPDKKFYQFCKKSDRIFGLLKKGEALLVDTDVCFHYGSRVASKPRKILYLVYNIAYSKKFPFFNREYLKDNFNILSNSQKIEKLVVHNHINSKAAT